jgi:hypothetical protein
MIQALIRQWYLLFRRKACIMYLFKKNKFGDIIKISNSGTFKCIGNNWYYKIGVYEKRSRKCNI